MGKKKTFCLGESPLRQILLLRGTEPNLMSTKRRFERYNCHGSAELTEGATGRVWGHLNDISLGGFYVSTFGPLPIQTEVRFKLEVAGTEIWGVGCVATSHPGVGMAVVFQETSAEYQHSLEEVIRELASSVSASASIGLRV